MIAYVGERTGHRLYATPHGPREPDTRSRLKRTFGQGTSTCRCPVSGETPGKPRATPTARPRRPVWSTSTPSPTASAGAGRQAGRQAVDRTRRQAQGAAARAQAETAAPRGEGPVRRLRPGQRPALRSYREDQEPLEVPGVLPPPALTASGREAHRDRLRQPLPTPGDEAVSEGRDQFTARRHFALDGTDPPATQCKAA